MSIEKELSNIHPRTDTLVTIGVFDGVHIGHQFLLSFLNRKAKENGWLGTAITFKTHPETIVVPVKKHPWLTDLNTRLALIRNIGIDLVLALPFDREISRMEAWRFTGLLKSHLNMMGLVIGPDFAMGSNRQGTVTMLKQLGTEIGFNVDIMKPFTLNGEVVSSSTIRQLLSNGNIQKAASFLGRPFRFTGQVIEGDKIGRTLGFPTANMETNPEFAIPGNGVYTTMSIIGNRTLPSVTNIGMRPTFGGMKHLIETHILDYQSDIYGQTISIDFIDRIRDEVRFGNVDALKAQMAQDVVTARAHLSNRIPQQELIR